MRYLKNNYVRRFICLLIGAIVIFTIMKISNHPEKITNGGGWSLMGLALGYLIYFITEYFIKRKEKTTATRS